MSAKTLPLWSLIVLAGALAVPARGTELKPRTAQAFDRYVERTEARIKSELADPRRFLYIDSLPEEQKRTMLVRLHSGQVIVQPMHTQENGKTIDVPDGLVHHWLAIGFIPGVTRDQALALAQDYSRHPQVYAPDVVRTQVLAHQGQHYEVLFRFHRTAILTVVYNTEFSVDYFFPDASRAYSFARAVRIAEVRNPGKPDEKEMPAGNDHGYIWRLNLYTRYLERDGGVYIQEELLALSRTVPGWIAWLVNPYVKSVPRDYLERFVIATRKGLETNAGK